MPAGYDIYSWSTTGYFFVNDLMLTTVPDSVFIEIFPDLAVLGTTKEIRFEFNKVNFAGFPPTLTSVTFLKFAPVTITLVPTRPVRGTNADRIGDNLLPRLEPGVGDAVGPGLGVWVALSERIIELLGLFTGVPNGLVTSARPSYSRESRRSRTAFSI